VDANGRESGPSGQGDLVHPLILSKALPAAKASSYFQAPIEVSASIGDLVSTDFPNGQPYNIKFRNADELVFEVTGAPNGLTVNSDTGVLAGFLPLSATGKYELAIKVTDKRTGKQDAVKLPLIVSAFTKR
jgi:hypothetical protein